MIMQAEKVFFEDDSIYTVGENCDMLLVGKEGVAIVFSEEDNEVAYRKESRFRAILMGDKLRGVDLVDYLDF